jgi:hypothetical protein
VLVLGSATAVAGGQEPAGTAAGGGTRGGSSSSRQPPKAASTAAGGGGAAEGVCPPAHELAWGYDVVITTFQRLSSDWSMRSDPQLAERLVLLKVREAWWWWWWIWVFFGWRCVLTREVCEFLGGGVEGFGGGHECQGRRGVLAHGQWLGRLEGSYGSLRGLCCPRSADPCRGVVGARVSGVWWGWLING